MAKLSEKGKLVSAPPLIEHSSILMQIVKVLSFQHRVQGVMTKRSKSTNEMGAASENHSGPCQRVSRAE
jgi:hypothetical protein